jgi:adenylate cyclase
MFTTFRHRLLFWFLVFICFNIIILILALSYLQSREEIADESNHINENYTVLLKAVAKQQDFFNFDTRNPDFFVSGTSRNLLEYDSLYSHISTKMRFKGIVKNAETSELIFNKLHEVDSLFKVETALVLKRGYKDNNLEGEMRKRAHWLENKSKLNKSYLLMLRRHEKDYIIRNEIQYVEKLNSLAKSLIAELPTQDQDSTRFYLQAYLQTFNSIVELDIVTGLNDNTGLKLQLDIRVKELSNLYEAFIVDTQKQQLVLYRQMTIYYGLVIVFLLLLSLGISFLMAKKITKPLIELTEYITRFVDSNFTVEEGSPSVRSKDEIGKLTQNFTLLKSEVISTLKYFKQKVEERTKELAMANERLVKINQANSRFVPNEFVHYLNRKGIEEVNLGDHSERDMTVMFTDIRSFTEISEGLSPQENFDFLNRYLKEIVPVIQLHGGFIDKYIGDSIMALFPQSPLQAMRAAIEMSKAIEKYNRTSNTEPISIGIGIHYGKLILGTIGHEERLDTTVISDVVNVASRVEGLTRHYNCTTIVTTSCLEHLPNSLEFTTRYLGEVKVKGKRKQIEIVELLHEADEIKKSYQKEFGEAVHLFKSRRLEEAVSMFLEIQKINSEDGAVNRFLDRCRELIKNGFPNDWDGIEIMNLK